MRVMIAGFAGLMALSAASSEAAHLLPANTGRDTLGAAPPIEFVAHGCGHGYRRTSWQDEWGYWHWDQCVPKWWGKGAFRPPDPTRAQTAAQAGRQFALGHCDTCHVVAAQQEMRPLVPGYAPSFFDVANKPSITAQSLKEFLAHAHPYGKMPYPELNAAQVSNLVSYILSLRSRH
jgi:mono/diheme cytochrome c family protein